MVRICEKPSSPSATKINQLCMLNQSSALEQHAASNYKVLVVANPANTNALILKEFAPSILEKNITCLTRLDQNRAHVGKNITWQLHWKHYVGKHMVLDISWWFSVFILCGYIFYGGCPSTWNGLSSKAFTELWDFFKLALAFGVMVLLENVYYRFLVIASGGAGSSHVAVDALSICVTLFGWESIVPLGILAATGVRVAIELGAGNVNNAKFAAKVCMLTSIVIGLIFFTVVLAIPDRLAMIFTPNSSVISNVHELAVLLGSTILLNSVPPVNLGIAVGSGWQVFAAYINIRSYYFVGVPLGIFIGHVLKFGYMGIWVGMLGGSLTQIMLLAAVASKLEWEKEVLKARCKHFMMNKALDD